MEEILNYVNRQIRHGQRLMHNQASDSVGQPLPYRQLYFHLKSKLELFYTKSDQQRWSIITGLRGVGKTTLMAQLYIWLRKNFSADSFELLYVALDEVKQQLGSDLNQLLDACELQWGEFDNLNKPCFLFLDEVHSQPQAFQILKTIYDKAPQVFLLCSGSTTVDLVIGADIAGRRASVEKLQPLDFVEYQALRQGLTIDNQLRQELNRSLYYSASGLEVYKRLKNQTQAVNQGWLKMNGSQSAIRDYLQAGGLPFLMSDWQQRQDSSQAVLDIINKAITYDLPPTNFNFTLSSIQKISRLIGILALATETPSLAKLSRQLEVSQAQLILMLEALLMTGILNKVPAYSRRSLLNSGRPAKYYFASPALRASLNNKYGDSATFLVQRGPLLEDLVVAYLQRQLIDKQLAQLKFWRTKTGADCDFVLNFLDYRLVIEVGWGRKSDRQAASALNHIKARYGLVFSRADLVLSDDQNIVNVPLRYLLLS